MLGGETPCAIARELVRTVRANTAIDWTMHENVRAQLRVPVKRIPGKYGYPPDKQEKATQTALEQGETLSEEWAGALFHMKRAEERKSFLSPGPISLRPPVSSIAPFPRGRLL